MDNYLVVQVPAAVLRDGLDIVYLVAFANAGDGSTVAIAQAGSLARAQQIADALNGTL